MEHRVPDGLRIDRRTFLKVAGLSALGMLAAERIFAQDLTAPSTLAGPDPIVELALGFDFDSERIFRFVSEEIRYEPYAGVLRGARGTLMGRAGNSADQAVLLAALLRASAVPVRYAIGSIDDATAEALASSAVTDVATARRELLESLLGTGPGGRPVEAAVPDAEAQAAIDTALAQADRIVAWAREALTTSVSALEGALADAGIDVPRGFVGLPSSERVSHAWIQAASGSEWIDLDPSLPAAAMGDAPGTPIAIHDAWPDDLRHRLRFSVIAETVASGALRQETHLEVEEFADVLAGRSIGVLNVERQGLEAIGAAITGGLEGGTTYQPCLVVGDEVVVGSGAIRFGGDPDADPFGELATGSPPPREGEPTAEWIEVTIHAPGADPVIVRREIFDRIGPAARTAGAPDLSGLGPAELVRMTSDGPPDFVPAQRTHWLNVRAGTVGGQELADALRSPVTGDALTNVVRAYHVVREATGAELGLPLGLRMFPDAPNLVALTVDQELGPDGESVLRPVIDIWHRSLGTVPVAGIEPGLAPALAAGVLPHVVERLMAGEAVTDPRSAAPASAGALLDQARREGRGLRVVLGPDHVEALPYPADALARLRAGLADGFVAVVPEGLATAGDERDIGWWLIDPVSGRTLDQMGDGRGVAVEHTTVTEVSVQRTPIYRRLGLCAASGIFLAVNIFFVVGGIAGAGAAGGGAASSFAAAMAVGGTVGGGLIGGGLLGGACG